MKYTTTEIRIITIATILLAASMSLFAEDFTGARPLGMGRTFTGLADDANAMEWNPAGIASFRYFTAIAGFNRDFLGVTGDNIGFGYVSLASQYRSYFAYGASWRYMFSDVYSENIFKLGLAHQFGIKRRGFFGNHPLCLGVNFRFEGVGYNTANFVDDDDSPVHIGDDPVFANGTSKWGFSMDAGLLLRITRQVTIGVSALDILEPNLALLDDEYGKRSMNIRMGASYALTPDFLVAADGRYYKAGSSIITPHLGLEKWFSKHTVAVRGGANPDELAFGLGWRLNREWALQIDYAFLYPINELSSAGFTSHKFSAMFQLPNPIPMWDLAAVSVDPSMTRVKPGDEVKVTATFKNGSSNKVKSSKYSAYMRKPDGTYSLLTKGELPEISSGAETKVDFSFTAFQPGEYMVYAAVDDDASELPTIKGTIEELDEANNVAGNMIKIFPGPVPTISFRQDTLNITRLTFQETELPIVPIIFFDNGSAEIPERYKPILDKLADRIKNNPDVVINVSGYVDPDGEGTDPELGTRREDAVVNYIAAKVGAANQIRRNDANDPKKRLAGGGQAYAGMERYNTMVQSENRRVELSSEIPSLTLAQVEQTIKYPDKVCAVSHDFSPQAATYKSILERNPDIMLLIEGYANKADGPNCLEPAFKRSTGLKDQLKKVVPFYLWDRIFAWGSDKPVEGEGFAKISLLADGIIYKPFEGKRIPKGVTVENPQNFVQTSVQADNAIISHRMELVELGGDKVKQFAVGEGEPAAGLPWDWKLDNSDYLQGGKFYVGHVTVTDELGAVGEAYSETLVVNQIDKVLGIETMLIVVFQFDKDAAISPYYHSRMEAVARRIIELAEHEPGELTVAVTGHTDVIGLARRNQELSEQRGATELENLKIYLSNLLNLPTFGDVDKWLAERKVKLITEGFGDKTPYTLKKISGADGSVTETLLGDNNLPEGRIINRRVLVEFRSKLKAE